MVINFVLIKKVFDLLAKINTFKLVNLCLKCRVVKCIENCKKYIKMENPKEIVYAN